MPDEYDVSALARYANSGQYRGTLQPKQKPVWRDENSVSSAEGRGWDTNTLNATWDSRSHDWW
jgi:hypothetical protein